MHRRALAFACILIASAFAIFSPMVSAGQVTLAWDASPSTGVQGYRVHYGLSSGSYTGSVNAGNQTTTAVTGLTDGQTYYFAVTAYAGGSESGFSNEVSAQVPAAAPAAAFSATPTSGSAPLTVAFSDGSSGSITSWSWDFGDGASSTAQNPSHAYASAGDYTVALTVTGPGGSDTATQTGYIHVSAAAVSNPVTADFTANPTSGAAPLTVTFTDISTGDVGTRSWDFGDGSSSTAAQAAHTYATPGTYAVSLTVTSTDGATSDTKTGTITATDPAPIADFTGSPTTGAGPLAVNFQDASSGNISSRQWSFGDGSSSTATNPTHTYQQPGKYTVTLTVSGPDGTDAATKANYVTVTGDEPAMEAGQVQVNQNWVRVTFKASFLDPVVVAKPLSYADTAPAVVRIRNVDPTGFEIRVQEWDYLDGVHGTETVSYLAMERGSYKLAGGARVEAGRVDTDKTYSFDTKAFDQSFGTAPIVLTAITTENETDAVTTRIRNITSTGFELRLREQDSNVPVHAQESVSYIAWEPSVGTLPGFTYEIRRTPDTVTDVPYRIDYKGTYASAPFFLADMQTTNGGETANLRRTEADASGVSVKVAEEQSLNTDTAHTAEVVGYAVFSALDPQADTDGDGLTNADETDLYGTQPHLTDTDKDGIPDGEEVTLWGPDWGADYDGDGVPNLLDPDADGDGALDGVELNHGSNPADPASLPSLPLEAGELTIDQNWLRVTFNNSFVDPVVVAKPMSYNGADPAVVRIRNVDSTGFDIRVQEWDYLDGTHTQESVSYLVMERGSYVLPSGVRVEAGRVETGKTYSFDSKTFGQGFNTAPVVLAAITTENESDAVTTRIRNITSQGFDVRLREQDANTPIHAEESISYIACEPSRGTMAGLSYEAGRTPAEVTDVPFRIDYQGAYSGTPLFYADMQTTNGGETANLRLTQSDGSGATVKVTEEQSLDPETTHVGEAVGYIVIQ